ncbi:MAG TPA: type VI secretion system baseplate subunit TssF [Acidobacteriaceae bacterium]|jgi:type VI secretion system protein ImpG
MREELLEYYERELTYLRQKTGDFARKYPRVAGRLLLDGESTHDPHVERLLEGFAFVAARVHLRLDDDFPQMSEALLNLLYPTYLRPIPPMTIVECLPDPQLGKKIAGLTIPRGTPLVSKNTVNNMPVRFRTTSEVTLWPVKVSEAEWRQPERLQRPARSMTGVQAVAAARMRLTCLPDTAFAGMPLRKMRFYLSGDTNVVYSLYEMLSANTIEIQLQEIGGNKRIVTLGPENLTMPGFEPNEAVLPYDRRSMDGHRLLTEYFTLPEKFLFFDLDGLDALVDENFGTEVDVVILFSRFERPERQQVLELGINERTFRLGCTAAINLFHQTAEPILLSQARTSYRVMPDMRQAEVMEIYSIDEVLATNPKMRETTTLGTIYSFRHQTRDSKETTFWSATRKLNELGERLPSTVNISVVDLNGRLKDPEADVLTVRCTCTNFDLPSRLNLGASEGDFDATGFSGLKYVTSLRRPTKSFDPPDAKGHLWRLVSQLSLNYLSLSEEGRGAMQEILRLHNFTDSNYLENQIGAITKLQTQPHFAMVASDYGLAPARGTAVEIELDEQQFTGAGAFLFGAVLDRFLAGYASMNSFSQLTVRTNLRKEPMFTWQPRAGNQVLL